MYKLDDVWIAIHFLSYICIFLVLVQLCLEVWTFSYVIFWLVYKSNTSEFLGLHVDDSEVTLNVCLGKHFSGGELFFKGVRCDKHMNTEALPEVHECHFICYFYYDLQV